MKKKNDNADAGQVSAADATDMTKTNFMGRPTPQMNEPVADVQVQEVEKARSSAEWLSWVAAIAGGLIIGAALQFIL